MTEYDNTNKGALWQPLPDQKMILQGRIDIEGDEQAYIVVKHPLKKGGEPRLVVYKRAGILFPVNSDNEKAPTYSGPLDDRPDKQIAAWKKTSNSGNSFLSVKVSDKLSDAQETSADANKADNFSVEDDDIPF